MVSPNHSTWWMQNIEVASSARFGVKGFLDMQGAKVLPMAKDRFIIRLGKL